MTTAPYGSWKSPITAELVVAGSVGLEQIVLDGDDLYWIEGRPAEAGRCVIVRRTPDGRRADAIPQPFNARTRVHEYGGASYTVDAGVLVFYHFADGRLYRCDPGADPQPITPAAAYRYADLVVDRRRGRLLCVREDHTGAGHEPINTLAAVKMTGDETAGQTLVAGHDFYASPRLSPDADRLAWLAWNHPNMPWDGVELWMADVLADGALANRRLVAGGAAESIFQPEWSPAGVLHFVSDRTGWWNLYRLTPAGIEPLAALDAEFGRPQWVFGMSTYGFTAANRLVCAFTRDGAWRLATVDAATKTLVPLDTPYTEIGGLRTTPGQAFFFGGSPSAANALVRLTLATGHVETLRRSSEIALAEGYLSSAQAIEFPTTDGLTAHAFFYPPRNRDYVAAAGEKPPLLVISHGGPTGATSSMLNLRTQYWTSRGIAVLDVNYRGSAGYGRAYREQLNGQWGVADVDDCVNAARYLVERGLVDPRRLAISGGSAGGYTTLCALTFRDAFQAGASRYGVCDLEALAQDTHKFESRYLDRLIGPYPERRDLYHARSPIHFTDRLACPLIFFQGLEDRVVPPSQSERMVQAARDRGLPVAYLAFEGEGHGFRRGENIKRSLEAELYFYSRIFGFDLAEPIAAVEIENLASIRNTPVRGAAR